MAEQERNKLGEAVAGFATGVYDAPKTMLQNQALGLSMFGAGADFGEAIPELKEIIPVFAKLENTNPDDQMFETLGEATGPEAAGFTAGMIGSAVGGFELLTKIKNSNPKAYKALREAFPYTVGQLHVKYKAAEGGKLKKLYSTLTKAAIPKGLKLSDMKKKNTTVKKLIRNFNKLAKIGLPFSLFATTEMGDGTLFDKDGFYKQEIVDANPEMFQDADQKLIRPKVETELSDEDQLLEDATTVPEFALGGDPGQFTDSIDMTGMAGEDVNIQDILNQSGYESVDDLGSLFDDAKLKPTKDEQMPEVQMANLFGKVPLWAISNVDKFKMLAQKFSKGEKSNLQNAEKKIGDTIIDSPETAESVFYSGLEARLMDPNTPKEFTSADAFFDFINKKGVGKAEIEDNALAGYIESARKNNTPLNAEEMLTIIRAAPIRKIDNVVYGSEKYGGTAPVKYAGYQERGALPDSYRESVMYLPSKEIPLDPDALPEGGAAHDFAQRYVIAWSRLTDRNATVPIEKTGSGIQLAADLASLRTMKKNQTKLNNQLKGLNASAYTKLLREGFDGPPVDTLNPTEIAQRVEMRTSNLEEIDPALLTQIRQFKSKIQNDSVRIKELEATTKGQGKTIVTFADEIQSDVLQNAKRFEEKLLKQMGDFLDATPADRRLAIQQADYGSDIRGLNPEVAEFYAKNRTVFRPLFKSDVEMQQFINEFQQNKKIFEDLAAAGTRPDGELVAKSQEALKKERQMLDNLQTAISDNAMRQLFPNLPFKTRSEWGEAVVKRDLAAAAQRLFVDKADDAAQWYAVSPAKFIKNRYSQSGGTNVPVDQRTKDMKGIGTEEFYGGPDSVDYKGKHYTSVLEKALKRAAKENNSEFKIIKIDGIGDAYAIKITPEMLLPHKTHRKKGGVVYTPEIIDIFEVA
jgi:cell fate (sporulation/competence/biofilm development) regulator YlbF (YheA/YmcA/DUF963 family)